MGNTLIIHIGWHKTATSAIQLYLNGNRDRLRELGVCYPVIDDRIPSGRIRHSYLFHSIRHRLQLNDVPLTEQVRDFDEVAASSAEDMAGSGCPFSIISDEGLSMPNQGIAQLMARFHDYFENIKIIAYLRRQDYFLESFYAQLVKVKPYRIATSFTEFLSDPGVLQRVNYDRVLDWWAGEFGRDNVKVMPFERETMRPDPVTSFFRLAGLPESILEERPLMKTSANVTPPREVTDYFRRMNEGKFVYFPKVLGEYIEKCSTLATDKRYLDRSGREEILARYEDSNKAVARKYLGRDDGILFTEPVVDYANCPETWQGLQPEELLDTALTVTGRMSIDIAVLRQELSKLDKEVPEPGKKCRKQLPVKTWVTRLKQTVHRIFTILKP